LVHRGNRFYDFSQQAFFWTSYCYHNAELCCPRVAGRSSSSDHFIDIKKRVNLGLSRKLGRLRTKCTVFGARSRLGVNETFQLYGVAAVLKANSMGEGNKVGELIEGHRSYRLGFGSSQRPVLAEESGFGVSQGGINRHWRNATG
jgi:hypothetical protein